ncbi:uncharacterized protein LOC135384794 [Ornithodoros turicata]|uniref:uncharacterized protein LOC135384794 n=1 Tax=Ornithodoros turicata TaxID=34597 RepID=UPI00313A3089
MAAFRQGRSIDNVIDVVSSVQQAQSEGHLTVAAFLDVIKAYDSVLHSAVVATLQESGVGSRMVSWVRDFLSGRTLFVCTASGDTPAFPVTRGVQQGALNTIASYLADRGLRVSTCKTVAMAFTRWPFTSYPLHVAGTPLQFVTHCKYLGVIIDRQLSSSKHIKNLSIKTSRSVNVLRRISGASWGPTCRVLRQIHRSLVLGFLRYSIPVLHGLRTTHERELLSIQSRSLRACLGLPKTTETHSVLAEAREPLVTTLRDRETLRIYTRLMTRHPIHYLRTIDHDSPASAFGSLKAFLGGRHFSCDDEVKNAVRSWLLRAGKDFYAAGIQALVKRWEKYISGAGDYVEK